MTVTSSADHAHAEPPDPYRWLEAADAAEVNDWTARQEAAYLVAARSWAGARAHFAVRLSQLSKHLQRYSTPRPAGGRLFYTELPPGAEHPRLVVEGGDGRARVLLDPCDLDPSGGTTLERWEPSPDGRRLAYQVAAAGTEDSLLYVLDVTSGALLDGPIDRVRKSAVAWFPDGTAFYYVRRQPPHLRPGEENYHRRVRLHRVGADPDADPLIFGEGRGKTQHYSVVMSADGRWLTVRAAAGTDRDKEIWLADLDAAPPDGPRFALIRQHRAARSSLHIPAGAKPADPCYIATELDAPRGRLVRTTPGDPGSDTWTDLIAEDPDSVLEDFALLDAVGRPALALLRTRHAVGEIALHDADGALVSTLPIPPGGMVSKLRSAARNAHELWFAYSSFVQPTTVYRYDAVSGALAPWPDPAPTGSAPSPADADTLQTRRLTFRSADGTAVRMFVIARTDVFEGTGRRPAPTLLTAYGGFGQSLTPVYSPEAIAWAEAGGVFALANVRGGGEEGEAWHRAGMRERKKKCFEDFEAAADRLVAEGLSAPGRLGIWGSSNGGLLIGAAITRHPEKYAAAACVAPLLDMARYELSGMGPSWSGEYGTASDPEQMGWLLSYSPYHHVRPGAQYPAVLFAVFDGDTRVDPLHARKMCAALRDATASGNPVLFRLERGTGHGIRATSRRTALFADLLAFFAARLGLDGQWAETAH